MHAFACPGEDDLNGHGDRDGGREQDAFPAQPGRQGEQEQDDAGEEDEVAEGCVEAEPVVEELLADQPVRVRPFLVAELLSGVEGPYPAAAI